MSKKNKIILCVLLLVYVIALLVFHITYEYTTYWDEESSIIMRYSFVYIIIGLIIYLVLNWKAFALTSRISNLSLKGTAKIVAYASALNAFFCLSQILFEGYFYDNIPFIHTAAWIVVSVFFFTLYKNMK